MARYDINTSHIVYQPQNLSLNTDDHRASLDGNQVAVLSGVDPKRGGSLRRAFGGRHIKTLSVTPEEMVPYQFTGNYAAEMLETTLGAAITPTSASTSETFTVYSTAGFMVGECVAIFKDNVAATSAYIGKITAISSAVSMTVSRGTGTIDTTAAFTELPIGSRVVRTCITGSLGIVNNTWSSVTATSIFRLAIGMSVIPLRTGGGNGTLSNTDVRTIASITASGTTFAITLNSDPDWTAIAGSGAIVAVALVPVKSSFDQSGVIYSSSSGFIGALHQATNTTVLNGTLFGTTVRSSSVVGNSVFSFSSSSHPVRVVPCSMLSEDQHCHVGWPDLDPDHSSPVNWLSEQTAGSTTGWATGTYRFFIRAIDETVYPVSKSPPLYELETQAADNQILVNFGTSGGTGVGVMTTWYSLDELFYNRATSFQIYATAVNLSEPYYLIAQRHLSFAQNNLGVWNNALTIGTGGDLGVTSTDILFQDALPDDDFMKYMPPMAEQCYYALGCMFAWGKTTATNHRHWTPLLTDNLLVFSRTDTEEPENFPPENYKPIGKTGDKIQGCTVAGSYLLCLSQNTYTLISRAGTYIIFDEYDQLGHGCPHKRGFCSMGPAAAWIGDEQVWVVQPDVSMDPVDIGAPIADWIRSLVAPASGTNVVRMGYDAIEQALWITSYNTTLHTFEARLFHVPSKTWSKREAIKVDALSMARGISTSATPWTFYHASGTNLFQTVDRVMEPKMLGGWDESTAPPSGANSTEIDCSSFRGTNSVSYTDGTLAAAADSGSGYLDLGSELLVAGAWVGHYLKLTNGGTHYYYITANTTQVITLDTDETPDSTEGNLFEIARHFVTTGGHLYPIRLSPALTTQIDAAGELIGSVMTFLNSTGATVQATRLITAAAYDSHFCEAVGGVDRKVLLVTITSDSYDPFISYSDRWIISSIPFRLRFPPIRGEDPFVEKTLCGAQILLDSVDLPEGQETGGIDLGVAAYRNFGDTLTATGQTATMNVKETAVTLQDSNFAAALRCSGRVIEPEIFQLDNWGNFEILFAGFPVKTLGLFADDRSATV